MNKKLLLLACIFTISKMAFSQTWDGSTSTAWNVADNWTPAAVPTAASNVTIPNTVVKPALSSNITINSLNMSAGSGLNFNGFSLSIENSFNFNGATLTNSSLTTDIVISCVNNASSYLSSVTVSDNMTLNLSGNSPLYEAYNAANTFNGNATFNLNGTGDFRNCYNYPSTFNGDLSINRTVAGESYILSVGATIVDGNFSYTNAVGGLSYIGQSVSTPTAVDITGTVNINVSGAGNPAFIMRKIKNQATGGTVAVLNSGSVNITYDTLLLSAMNITGFGNAASDIFENCVIGGNVVISDVGTNTGAVYLSNWTNNGNFSFTLNSDANVYETYNGGNIYNGNVIFNVNGAGDMNLSYNNTSAYNGDLSINRTVAGTTNILTQGFTALTGNFSYTNNAGGASSINNSATQSATIGGTVNITATGAGNPAFTMRRIKNATSGGAISLQNSGLVTIMNDTLLLTAMTINGFTGAGSDYFEQNIITGNVDISDAPENTGSIYMSRNIFNGNFTYGLSSTANLYETYNGGNTYNGNTTFSVSGTGNFNLSYNNPSAYNGNLAITRTAAGASNILGQGFTALTGNFSYSNNAGGASDINASGASTAIIGGTVNIAVSGTGNPAFSMRKIHNNTLGGTISILNSGNVLFISDTLAITSMTVSGFTGPGTDQFENNVISGTVVIADAAANSGATYLSNNTFNGDFEYSNNSPATLYETYNGRNRYNGNARFNRAAGSILLTYNNSSFFGKNLILNAASGISFSDTLTFNGNTNALIDQVGTQALSLPRIVIDKAGSTGVTLNDPLTVTIKATFIKGYIHSAAGKELIFADNATQSGNSGVSNVTGPIIKNGTTGFPFPSGRIGSSNSVTMSAPAAASSFSVQYFKQNATAAGYDTSLHAGTLARVSGCEYWDIKRLTGTSNVTLTFTYGDSCSGLPPQYINDPTKVRIAHWNGSNWEDLGNGGSAGTTSGTVTTAAPVNSFSPFTFASTDLVLNPLPVRLISFNAVKQEAKTLLRWKADNEINFNNYEIERSRDGINYVRIGTVARTAGSGEHQYSFTDNTPVRGKNFYRLKMTDFDGSRSYSNTEQLLFSNATAISIYPNPASDEIKIISSGRISVVTITDATGRFIKKMAATADGRYNIRDLAPGIYFITATDAEGSVVTKILKQ